MDATSPEEKSRGPSPRRCAGALAGLLHGQVALFGEELKEQQGATLQLLIFAGLGVVFSLMLIIGLSAALLIVFWDTHRFTVTFSLCAFYAAGLLTCGGVLLHRLRNAPTPFSASLEELARDREQLLR
ncbi:MAG: phage holin family protein [Pseudomonas sp.]|uniref:phage holin family protein n=1 Tax=Pseudomonas sp. TaxID=306 RepID=UPI003D0BA68E